MRLIARLLAFLAAATLEAQPLAAQSILRDAETEAFLDEIPAPLIEAAGQVPIELGLMAAPAKLILCFAMVLGRLETLAIIALLSPNLWRS